ncbi:hypothetical protein U1Q18_031717 [Sarracenia purpurea var. burkii]
MNQSINSSIPSKGFGTHRAILYKPSPYFLKFIEVTSCGTRIGDFIVVSQQADYASCRLHRSWRCRWSLGVVGCWRRQSPPS